MARKKGRKGDRLSVSLSAKQIELIDKIVEEGVYGNKRQDVIRAVIVEFLKRRFEDSMS